MKLLVPVRRENRIVLGVAFFIVFVALWSFLSMSGAVPKHFLATPWQTVASGWNLFATHRHDHLARRRRLRAGRGMAVPLGVAMGATSRSRRSSSPSSASRATCRRRPSFRC
jgi:NitT/TauT family transport system permease protein